jgi:hypothetical protein
MIPRETGAGWILLTALLALSCSKVNGSGTNACVANDIYSTQFALGVNDTATGGGSGALSVAQSFLTPGTLGGTNVSITSVNLPLYAVGTIPAGNLTLKIRADNTGSPGAVAGSTVVAANTSVASTTPGLITFTFSTPVSVTAGSPYWLNLDAQYGQTNNNIVKWAADDVSTGTGQTYSNGLAKIEIPVPPATGPDTFNTGNFGTGRELGFEIFCQ